MTMRGHGKKAEEPEIQIIEAEIVDPAACYKCDHCREAFLAGYIAGFQSGIRQLVNSVGRLFGVQEMLPKIVSDDAIQALAKRAYEQQRGQTSPSRSISDPPGSSR